MKRLKLATVFLTSLLALTLYMGCGEDTSSDTVAHPPVSFESVKHGDLFYFLKKTTTNIAEYPALDNYSLIAIDMEDSTEYEISKLQNNGKFVICYVDVGTWEGWRADAGSFPSGSKGNADAGWANEQWLDITNPTVLSLMEKRIDRTAAKGCNGIEFDNIDGYSNNTGFTITAQQQLTYNTALANYAHSKNLITAFKTDLEQIDSLEPYFDMAINESCHFYGECDKYNNFSINKPVFNIEYIDGPDAVGTAGPIALHPQTSFFKSYLSNIALDGTYYVKLPL